MNKILSLNEIEQTMQELFLSNLNFFKNHHPHIYDNLLKFEKLNTENYSIEFKNNKFELLDYKNNLTFYENDPFTDSINRIKSFNLGSAFNLIKIESLKNEIPYKNEINAYEYLNEFIKNFNHTNIQINKFIFIGTLLGIHINDFDKVLNAKTYLIIEPDIEIFKLSMFMTDYKILSINKKLFFAIQENENSLKKIVKDFLNHEYQFNNLIHFELIHDRYSLLLNQLTEFFTYFGQMRYPFSDYLLSLNRLHYYTQKKSNMLKLNKIYNFLEMKKVLFLGAGPSLEKNLNFVYKNKDKFIIVAVAATLKTLEQKKIIPDIIITVDGHHLIKEQFNVNKTIYENSIILSSIKLDPDIYKLLKNSSLFFFQNSLNLCEELGSLTGVTVGDIGIDLLLRLGIRNLYLLGIDASLDPKTRRTHIKTHIHSKKITEEQVNSLDFNKTIFFIKGNLRDKVPTLMEYIEMIEEINDKFIHLNNNFKIFNLSNGAYFKNTISIKSSEIKLEKESINKTLFKNNLKKQLQLISKERLELKSFLEEKFQIEKEILSEINNLLKDNYFFEYFDKIQLKYPNSMSINILKKYFQLILPYHNFLKNKQIADTVINKQINEIICKLDSIFS